MATSTIQGHTVNTTSIIDDGTIIGTNAWILRKVDNIVFMQCAGLSLAAGASSISQIIPEGYRPPGTYIFTTFPRGGTSVVKVGLQINSSGTIDFYNYGSTFSNISFRQVFSWPTV